MNSGERAQLEAQTERHLRRGELSEAWATLSRLAEAFPQAYAARLQQLEESLEPAEWRRVTQQRGAPSGVMKTPSQYAESLVAEGHFTEAMELYRALLDENPDQELVKERLSELYQLARVATPSRPPVDRTATLEHLLERISSRRRP